jgi:ferredoxin
MEIMRKIIEINEERCDGCGQCAQACAEGAIEIIDGKAKLVSEIYCDGLGACIGDCPQDAIRMVERPAAPFDSKAVLEHHLEQDRKAKEEEKTGQQPPRPMSPCGCPGSAARKIERENSCCNKEQKYNEDIQQNEQPSMLGNWPVQLRLVPVHAPYFQGAKVLIAGDCTPFAYRNFHERFMDNRTVLIGCPKLDDPDLYRQKLAQLFREQEIDSIEVVIMEVPCCRGLAHIVEEAIKESGKSYTVKVCTVSVGGEVEE